MEQIAFGMELLAESDYHEHWPCTKRYSPTFVSTALRQKVETDIIARLMP